MEKRQKCISLVDEARRNGLNDESIYKLSNGEEVSWFNEVGNQQGQAWECSLRLCRAIEQRAARMKGAKVIELVSLLKSIPSHYLSLLLHRSVSLQVFSSYNFPSYGLFMY